MALLYIAYGLVAGCEVSCRIFVRCAFLGIAEVQDFSTGSIPCVRFIHEVFFCFVCFFFIISFFFPFAALRIAAIISG